jgi:glutathione S-transferase
MNPWIVIVTVLALVVYLWTGISVGRGRGKYGVSAPAMIGNPDFERLTRIQTNTLEWVVIFLPCLWMFANLVSAPIAAGLGVVWIVGRILYAVGYAKEASKRGPGFGIQALATLALLIGSLGGAVWKLF